MMPVTRHRPCTVERVVRSAVLSDCGTYRYVLTRRWVEGPLLGWVMLNPSTADAERDDPTIRRCMGFARTWGFAGIIVRNLYAARSSSPAALWSHPEPGGPANDQYLAGTGVDQLTVCAWGALGARQDRAGWSLPVWSSSAPGWCVWAAPRRVNPATRCMPGPSCRLNRSTPR
jgi:hypothetical protein